MKSFRKLTAVVLATVMTVSLLFMTACSTPAVAMTVDGKDYTTGEYLANLYMNFYNVYYQGGLYQYASYGMDPWTQSFPYGEGDDAQDLALADYLVAMTKDSIVRQKAVENLMAKYGISVPEEEMKQFTEEMATYKESEMLAYGFNKEHYMNMYIALNMNEQELFYQLYDVDGQKAVSEAEIRDYFDNQYVAYKAITISQMGEDGKALSDTDKEANRVTLQGYLDQFNKSKDMDAVIAQYEKDTAPTTTTAAGQTTTTTAATTTTTVTTTTTTTTTTTAAEGTTTTTAAAVEEETTEEEEDPNLQMLNSATGDEKVVAAIHAIPENTAQIIEYTDSNDQTSIALVYRLNTEEAGGKDYYKDQHDTIVYGLKFDEFDAEVQALVDTFEVNYNDRAIKMCDPKSFETAAV